MMRPGGMSALRISGIRKQDDSEERAQFAKEDEIFFEKYQVATSEILGQGTSCFVRRGERRQDQLPVALKVMRTDDEELHHSLRQELELLKSLRHKNIVRAYEEYHSRLRGEVYLVLELCGKSLERHVLEDLQGSPVPEERARVWFAQLADALLYLHKKRIVHRDLKPENLLFCPNLLQLKLADFNHSRQLSNGGCLTAQVGSYAFAAPEFLLRQTANLIGEQVDVWALGMCLYYMFSGGRLFFRPEAFKSPSALGAFLADQDTQRRKRWVDQLGSAAASEEAKEVILGCLAPEPDTRPCPSLLLAHPWVSSRLSSLPPSSFCPPAAKHTEREQGQEPEKAFEEATAQAQYQFGSVSTRARRRRSDTWHGGEEYLNQAQPQREDRHSRQQCGQQMVQGERSQQEYQQQFPWSLEMKPHELSRPLLSRRLRLLQSCALRVFAQAAGRTCLGRAPGARAKRPIKSCAQCDEEPEPRTPASRLRNILSEVCSPLRRPHAPAPQSPPLRLRLGCGGNEMEEDEAARQTSGIAWKGAVDSLLTLSPLRRRRGRADSRDSLASEQGDQQKQPINVEGVESEKAKATEPLSPFSIILTASASASPDVHQCCNFGDSCFDNNIIGRIAGG